MDNSRSKPNGVQWNPTWKFRCNKYEQKSPEPLRICWVTRVVGLVRNHERTIETNRCKERMAEPFQHE